MSWWWMNVHEWVRRQGIWILLHFREQPFWWLSMLFVGSPLSRVLQSICSSSVIAHSVWHSIHTFPIRFLEYPRSHPVIAIPPSIRFEFQFKIFLLCFILCNKYLLIKMIFCIFFGNLWIFFTKFKLWRAFLLFKLQTVIEICSECKLNNIYLNEYNMRRVWGRRGGWFYAIMADVAWGWEGLGLVLVLA